MNKTWDKPLNFSKLINEMFSSGIFLQILAAVGGFLASKGEIMGGLHPFGIALAAGVDPTYFISATAGAALGSITFPTGMLFRHIAALFAIVSIRYLFSKFEQKKRRPFLSALLCFCITIITGFVAAIGSFAESLPIFGEGIIAGASAYFISISGSIFPLKSRRKSEVDTVGTIIFLNIILIGLYSFEIAGISPGRICATALILAAGRYGGIAAGAVSGSAAAMAFLLTGQEPLGALALAIGGVFAGFFRTMPKIVSPFSVLLCSAVLWFSAVRVPAAINAVWESAAGCVIFLFLPKIICVYFSGLFAPETARPTLEGMQASIRSKLKGAALAIFDVSRTVDEVAERLKQINSPSFEQSVTAIEKEACRGCCLRLECWETQRTSTVMKLVNACGNIRNGNFFPDILNDKYEMGCLRTIQVAEALKENFAAFNRKADAEKRLSEIREVVSDQFCGISDMLYELSTEFGDTTFFDTEKAAAAAEALEDMGITATEIGCLRDKDGHLHFEIKIPLTSENINRADIVACLSETCGKDFSAPKVTRGNDYLQLYIGEQPLLTAEVGLCQLPENSPANMCGDSANWFFDSHGKLFMVLSDGMGTGGRAAVDGALLSSLMTRMLDAGFSADCALRLCNSAMLFRSSDESMATADIISVDLFNGKTDMHKAGAAPTLVRKRGRTGIAESRSLPAGILREIKFDHASIGLSDGDIIIMMSDGAVADGTDWICAELENWGDGSAAQLANHIAQGAARRRNDGHTDDITVLAAILHS